MNEVCVVFIDDIESVMEAQDELFIQLLPKYGVTDTKKTVDGFSFKYAGLSIVVLKRMFCFSLEKDKDSLPDDVKTKASQLLDEFRDKKTLFVIDFCLDNEDYRTGKTLHEYLAEANNEKHDFMFTTSTVGLIDNDNTIVRAVHDNYTFDNDAGARKMCKFYPEKAKEVKSFEKYKGVLDQLQSRKRNNQYFGAIMFRTIKLSKKK